MVRSSWVVFLLLVYVSCKEAPKYGPVDTDRATNEPEVGSKDYPAVLKKVFAAHGGLDLWQSFRTLSFVIPKGSEKERHTIDLRTRKEHIYFSPELAIGFDGKGVWIKDKNQIYSGDPVFYHNLMFYFFAMPYVLADEGIHYEPTADLTFEGTSYPGIKIGFGDGVGISPKDEYYLYYHPQTHKMMWLGYTVTYGTDTTSNQIKYIQYKNWTKYKGLLLPSGLTWYKTEDNAPTSPSTMIQFDSITLYKGMPKTPIYEKPLEARYAGGH